MTALFFVHKFSTLNSNNSKMKDNKDNNAFNRSDRLFEQIFKYQ
jgi:hypothetical protein